jgi:pyruvate dehydrogenase E2 component (dihydrolipoamide acetyltransferase)
MTDIVMPRLSDTMEEGTILRWLKRDGEQVKRGEELVEIETDKAAMTYESDSEGALETVAREGDSLAVGELIARVGEPDANGAPATETPEPASVEAVRTVGVDGEAANGKPSDTGTASEVHDAAEQRVKASPLARRIARETGVDLREVAGSGPGGRIVKADVEQVAGSEPAPAIPSPRDRGPTSVAGTDFEPTPATAIAASLAPAMEEVSSAKGETITVELTRTQRTIARRMAESKATIPDFTLTADIDMERCVELREELKRLSHNDAPTYNDMIVKACALALRDHPRANGSYRDGRFELHARVNVGVAVAAGYNPAPGSAPTDGVLVVPTVFDADTKALGEIAREMRALAEHVREGTITPPELSGGTFTVSNLGMYGIRQFSAIINPPQAAIIAVGVVEARAVVRKKKVLTRHTMSVTLACDHRILYGADAAIFLGRVRELLEEPAALTL